jgi:hypothetical protein
MGKLSIMKREKRRVVIVVVYKVTIGFTLSKKKCHLKSLHRPFVIVSTRSTERKGSSFVGQGRWVSP